MKSLVLLLIVLAAAFFAYPLLAEDASSECDALERAAIRHVVSPNKHEPKAQDQLLGQLIQGLSKGRFAGVAVRNEYPNLPASVGCAALYWRSISNPEAFRESAAKLLR